ncbi:lipopolysaccharide-induced tumor necrosis factor-alpha factor homolog isoform X1 [Cimex lectularius]|uniref:LITAF domain-containing protein n=1 Tax=Cimex lectularius TaxID=79782 RepID=A0A8I6RJA1_CIMLE|nr:lipopolysaccharide-induced tumor necrosis factor-alpha factor homolog isoform X1 [Cimex lectularius]
MSKKLPDYSEPCYPQNAFVQPSAPPCYEEAISSVPPVNPPQSNNVAIIRTAPVMVGPKPIHTTCPSCEKRIKSRTTKENNVGKYLCCLCLLLSGIGILCSCIPLCVWSPVKTRHFCPNCNAFLGMYVS